MEQASYAKLDKLERGEESGLDDSRTQQTVQATPVPPRQSAAPISPRVPVHGYASPSEKKKLGDWNFGMLPDLTNGSLSLKAGSNLDNNIISCFMFYLPWHSFHLYRRKDSL